jgi:hypothetical protein
MTEEPLNTAPIVERTRWSPPVLKRVSASRDIEAMGTVGEDAEAEAGS